MSVLEVAVRYAAFGPTNHLEDTSFSQVNLPTPTKVLAFFLPRFLTYSGDHTLRKDQNIVKFYTKLYGIAIRNRYLAKVKNPEGM